MPIILNRSVIALPSNDPLTQDETNEMQGYKRRAHLEFPDAARDMKPLTHEERAKLEALELKWNDQRVPTWGPMEFPFAPYLKEGCAWQVRQNVASTLCSIHPKRLVQVPEDSDELKGLRLKTPKAYPTIEQLTPGGSVESIFSEADGWKNTSWIVPRVQAPLTDEVVSAEE